MAGNVTGMVLTNFPARSSQDLVIALVLADAADQDGGNVFPSVARVAALARCGERTVQYATQDFVARGFLVLLEKGGGRGKPSRYRIDLGWLARQAPVWRPFPENGAPDAPIPETAQTPQKGCGKGAEKVQKRCKKGAPASAPNPIPPTPDPLPTTTMGGGGGVSPLGEEDAEDLALALEAQAKAAGKKNPVTWAQGALRRIKREGLGIEEKRLLESFRDGREKERERQARRGAPPPGLVGLQSKDAKGFEGFLTGLPEGLRIPNPNKAPN